MQWFRMYAEFASDPKVQMMSEVYQRRWAMLLCMRCAVGERLSDTEIVFQMRISETEWSVTKAEFIERGFINKDNKILNWKKRQYKSDCSTERVYKHREKRAREQLQQQPGNVTSNAPEQNRTEQNRTEEKSKEKPQQRGTRLPAEFAVTDEHREFARKHSLASPESQIGAFRDHFAAKPGNAGVKLDWDATFRNWLRNARTYNRGSPSGFSDFKPPSILNPEIYQDP